MGLGVYWEGTGWRGQDKSKLFSFFFLAALCHRCCMRAFSSCGERGLLFIAVGGLLTVVASLIAGHGL